MRKAEQLLISKLDQPKSMNWTAKSGLSANYKKNNS